MSLHVVNLAENGERVAVTTAQKRAEALRVRPEVLLSAPRTVEAGLRGTQAARRPSGGVSTGQAAEGNRGAARETAAITTASGCRLSRSVSRAAPSLCRHSAVTEPVYDWGRGP